VPTGQPDTATVSPLSATVSPDTGVGIFGAEEESAGIAQSSSILPVISGVSGFFSFVFYIQLHIYSNPIHTSLILQYFVYGFRIIQSSARIPLRNHNS